MNKPFFTFLIGLFLMCYWTTSFGQGTIDNAASKCPAMKSDETGNSWKINNQATSCRATCIQNSDCTSIRDKCGRAIFTNKKFKSEIETAINSSNYYCTGTLEIVDNMESICVRKKCEPAFKSCDAEIQTQASFLEKKVKTECSTDADCSFFLVPEEKCIRRLPVGRTSDLTKNSLDLMYLRDSVVSACKMKSVKECNPNEKAFCVGKECMVFQEKPPYKNYVNLEGQNYIPNFSSNTVPIKMPRASHSKCDVDSDCTETTGICSQYIVSLNKKHLAGFKLELEKTERTIACPTSGKIQIPKSRCFKEFCSFVN